MPDFISFLGTILNSKFLSALKEKQLIVLEDISILSSSIFPDSDFLGRLTRIDALVDTTSVSYTHLTLPTKRIV